VVRATKVVFAALGIGALVFLFQILTTAIFQLETRVTWLKDSLTDTTQELVDATPPNAKI
jgi:hypothetical protein